MMGRELEKPVSDDTIAEPMEGESVWSLDGTSRWHLGTN